MKLTEIFFGDKKLVVAFGIGIIAITNVVALGGVAYNRAGSPDAVVELSERELGMPFLYGIGREDTGLRLQFKCRIADTHSDYGYSYGGCGGTPSWLDLAKLNQLGFRLQPQPESIAETWRYRNPLPREVYVVLEFNGDAYRKAVTDAEDDLGESKLQLASDPGNETYAKAVEQAKKRLDAEIQDNSRLFLIDAGRDKAVLRAIYTDSNRYIVTRALVRPFVRGAGKDEEWKGAISRLLVDSINLPYEYRELFNYLDNVRSHPGQNSTLPRYSVEVAFGKRSEPWVISARKL